MSVNNLSADSEKHVCLTVEITQEKSDPSVNICEESLA